MDNNSRWTAATASASRAPSRTSSGPQFEAILFAVLACSFYLLESFVDDLEDPFGGSWTVDAALDACDELVDALAVEE